MKRYKVIDIKTNDTVCEGYAKDIAISDTDINEQMVRMYALKGMVYHGKYRILDNGNDSNNSRVKGICRNSVELETKKVRRTKKNKDIGMNELERLNDEARKHGMSYGQYIVYIGA